MSGHPYLWLAAISLVLGLVAGVVLFRADYCMAGMFRDLFLFRQTFMLRTLLLLITVSMVLVEIARLLGLLRNYPFPFLGPPSLANLIGGALFGVGMVLAGGCVIGTLYKLGSGRRSSLLAGLGLILGSTLYAEIHPGWSRLVKATTLSRSVTLPQLLGFGPTGPILLLSALAGLVLWHWGRRGKLVRPAVVAGDLQPWLAAFILAGLGVASWLLVGMPLGITTGYAKIGAFLEGAVWPQHVARLSFFQTSPLVYRPPLFSTTVVGGPGPYFDAIAAVQLPLIAGIILGAFLASVRLGEFAPAGPLPMRQAISALGGGVVMGLAARLVPACNVWHLFGGVPVLAMQSLLFLLGMLPGAWLGSKMLARWVLKP